MKTILFFFIFFIIGCKSNSFDGDFNSYILKPENGLTKIFIRNDFEIKIIYRPIKLLRLDTENEKKESSKNIYFLLRIAPINQDANALLFQSPKHIELFKKMAYEIPNYITAKNSENKITNVKGYSYSEASGTMPYRDILLIFDKGDLRYKDTKVIDIQLAEFGLNTGDLSFEFKKGNIDRINTL